VTAVGCVRASPGRSISIKRVLRLDGFKCNYYSSLYDHEKSDGLHRDRDHIMPKAYWICAYRSINDPAALAEYGKLAGPALQKAGGRILGRATPSIVYEAGVSQRAVLIEFDSVEQAVAAHDSAGYQEALRALGNAAERDVRIIEGIA